MKCLKVEGYIQRMADYSHTEAIYTEIQDYVTRAGGAQARTVCDRVIRACNHQLGTQALQDAHRLKLVALVEVCLTGYDATLESGPQSSLLYMEKILFHILRNLSTRGADVCCFGFATLLYKRLAQLTHQAQSGDYCVLVRSCFAVLWSSTPEAQASARLRLSTQLQALSFLLLLDLVSAAHPLTSKVPAYAEEALSGFAKADHELSVEASVALLQQCQHFLFDPMRPAAERSWAILSEVLFHTCKVLCQMKHWNHAVELLESVRTRFKGSPCIGPVLELALLAVSANRTLVCGEVCAVGFAACCGPVSMMLRCEQEWCVALQSCRFTLALCEMNQSKALGGKCLLAWFSFLEQYQKLLRRALLRAKELLPEHKAFEQALWCSVCQALGNTCASLMLSQLEEGDEVERVLQYCRSTAEEALCELSQLSCHGLFSKTVMAVNSVVCALYNGRRYEQALSLAEVTCSVLWKKNPPSLPIDKLNRTFLLAVQSCRKAARLEQALDWVVCWLQALGDHITQHMAQPVALWVKTKRDASQKGLEDTRLRTLRDGFGPHLPEESVMLCLLREELRAYWEEAGDTAQERYNTLCDLLDICHEESHHKFLRAVYLCQMGQVVCFQDFTGQTDCSAVDFMLESVRLLEEEAESTINADQLKDEKAQALLWLFICTMEKNLQEAVDKEKQLRGTLQQAVNGFPESLGTNDMDYDEKQKDNLLVYEGVCFNLMAESKQCQPLYKALELWRALLMGKAGPAVRCAKQSMSAIVLMAELYKLMGKPLQALESYHLAAALSRHVDDDHCWASSLCHSARILLDLGFAELAEVQLEKAEKLLSSMEPDAEAILPMRMLAKLLRAELCGNSGQVELGVSHLCHVLSEVGTQRHSKSWYLLQAKTLQIASSFLALDTHALSHGLRLSVMKHGLKSPDAALYESMKLLCSLVVTLVGNGLYGPQSKDTHTTFVNQGENVLLKWQLLTEVLSCSQKLVAMLRHCGAFHEAKVHCLEALRLATKLQTVSQCAELLVVKAELELLKGDEDMSAFDLEQVKHLLYFSSDFATEELYVDRKIKPRKGKPTKKQSFPGQQTEDEDCKDLLSTGVFSREPVEWGQTGSPQLKARPAGWLSSLAHDAQCCCQCCSDPWLSRVCARWAATRAELDHRSNPNANMQPSSKLFLLALSRCSNVNCRLKASISSLMPMREMPFPSFLLDLVGRIYLHMSLISLRSCVMTSSVWKLMECGFSVLLSKTCHQTKSLHTSLKTTKAIALLLFLASQKNCSTDELFSQVWDWNPSKAAPKTQRLTKRRTNSVKGKATGKAKDQALSEDCSKDSNDKAAFLSMKEEHLPNKTPLVTRTSRLKSNFAAPVHLAHVPHTPVQKVREGPSARRGGTKAPSKLAFEVYEESIPAEVLVRPAPPAPKRATRSRFKIEFTDESDGESRAPTNLRVKAPLQTLSECRIKKKEHKRQCKKSTAVTSHSSSEDERTPAPATVRAGRSKKGTLATACIEEPERMRTIKEEQEAMMDGVKTSFDTDASVGHETFANRDVLRKNLWTDLEEFTDSCPLVPQLTKDEVSPVPCEVTLESVRSLLQTAMLSLVHFPSSWLYPHLCSILALCHGQQEAVTTAWLHSQALGVTARHHMIRHLANRLKKLKRASAHDLTDKMGALSLDNSVIQTHLQQRLTKLQEEFAFPTLDASTFPQQHCYSFSQQLQSLPEGVTVCLLSLVGVTPGKMGDTVLLSRLEKDAAPVTVRIPTSQTEFPVSMLVQQMDNILVEQKALSSVVEKAQWWEGRRALDERMARLLDHMGSVLGCWQGLLLPLSSEGKLSHQTERLYQGLVGCGVHTSKELLKAVLSASPMLSSQDLYSLASGLNPAAVEKVLSLLQAGVSALREREVPQGHVVLILDKFLQKLPWESISCLRDHSVSRMPSLHFLMGHCALKQMDPGSVLSKGVDLQKVFYVLNPDANLKDTEERFREWFSSTPGWHGVIGSAPDTVELQEAVSTKDVYIFVGHGAGARYLDGQRILKKDLRAVSLLFGCSSAALAFSGELEGWGIILHYLMAGCPLILGNLWDVTDRDIDRFTKALLQSWFSAGSGASLLDHMASSRQATHLRHLIGAAPVVYGLPVCLR